MRKTLRGALAKARYRSCVCDAAVQHTDKKTSETRPGRLARAVRGNARPKNASRALWDALLAPSGPLLATFWAPWAVIGPLWGPSGASRAPPGASQERPRAPPKRPESPESAQDRFLNDFSTFRIDFSSILGRFFDGFVSQLARLRRPFEEAARALPTL